jgi:type VI secretion system protein ImpG
LDGLECLRGAGMGDVVEILFFVSRFEHPERQQLLELGVSASTFRLGCTPVVNLFPQTAEPILMDQTRHEYPVVPDVRRPAAVEVFSVDEVLCTTPGSQEMVRIAPFYGLHADNGNGHGCYWHAQRRRVTDDDQRTEVHLSVVDSSGRLRNPDADTVTVRCTCSNANLPARLPFGNEEGDLELEGTSAVRRVLCLRRPTPSLPPPAGKDALWHLISHLSLNYLSLVGEGREALQHILQLYNFSDSPHLQNQIAGIAQVRSSRHFARVNASEGVISARGTRIELQLDEDQFVGGGVYLFASVLERFLALYTGINSFTQLVLTTTQRKGVVKEWPPRAGHAIVI